MKLFSKKKEQPLPPVITTPPASPAAELPKSPKTETILKLDLPDVFAFQQDATKSAAPARPRPSAGEEVKPLPGRGTVLLVESDDEVRRLMSRLLQHEGFHLQTATCLAEARTMLAETPADFVLARRACVPLNLQTEIALREVRKKAFVRVVDEFSDLILGQVVDYESLAQCTLSLTDLLLSLLEGANTGARGHAHTIAKYCRLVGQRLGMKRRDLDALTLAAYLHDLGSLETEHKISEPVLSANELLSPSLRPTLDLLGNIPFPYAINDLLSATGATATAEDLPATPLGARILRVVDTYDTLRRTRSDQFADEEQLFEWMRRQPTGTFDGDALETLIHIRKHERAINAMNLFSATFLLVDPHPDELQLLKLRLENDDYRVLIARTLEEALQQLRAEPVTLVLTEFSLDSDGAGFELLRTLKDDPSLRHIPVILHALPDTDRTREALELGAEDWFAKPHNVEIAAMKLQRIVGRLHATPVASDGVQGNLRDMGLVEMVQILCTGGRSVHIALEHAEEKAELVLREGRLISAHTGILAGEPAALAILGWREGTFRIRPLKDAPPVIITTSTDNLLAQRCAMDHTRQTTNKEPTT